MSPEGSRSSSPPGTMLVFSSKPPEEVRLFGLRGNDIERVEAPAKEETLVSPEEWGYTSTNDKGVCKYCQLMLHPDAPEAIIHQPNIQRLVNSECEFCGWVQVAVAQGLPRLAAAYSQGHPDLHNPESTSTQITISAQKTGKYTRLVPTVGERGWFAQEGLALNSTRLSELGDVAKRSYWKFHDNDDSPPHARLSILKQWLNECLEHEECSSILPAAGETKLPTRVLDLTGTPDIPSAPGDIKIKLRETSADEVGKYVALSYCWGPVSEYHSKTTSDNLDDHTSGIDWESLPPIHREAVLATLFMGVRYLWIDSFCIIQDSAEDWQAEAARMSTVYSNSIVTLAATACKNPEEWLFHSLDMGSYTPIHGDTVMLRIETHRTIDAASEPLNTRGWTLQEAVLSPRIVSFGKKQWQWKCPSRLATEDGHIDGPPPNTRLLNQWTNIVQRGPGDDGYDYLRKWYELMWHYSKRDLTYQSDKLKAIAGLVDVFAKQMGYQNVAGLWVEDFAAGLLWQTTSRGAVRDPTSSSIPSWSWASVTGEVMTVGFIGTSETSKPLLKLINVEQEWEGVPLSSQVKTARLTVQGTFLQLGLGKQSLTRTLRHHLVASPESQDEIFGEVFLDNTLPIEQGTSTVWWVAVYSKQVEGQELEHFGLVLVPAPNQDDKDGTRAYRRIGMGIVWDMSKVEGQDGPGKKTFEEAADTRLVLV